METLELVVFDVSQNSWGVIKSDILNEWRDHLSQYPDDYIVWERVKL